MHTNCHQPEKERVSHRHYWNPNRLKPSHLICRYIPTHRRGPHNQPKDCFFTSLKGKGTVAKVISAECKLLSSGAAAVSLLIISVIRQISNFNIFIFDTTVHVTAMDRIGEHQPKVNMIIKLFKISKHKTECEYNNTIGSFFNSANIRRLARSESSLFSHYNSVNVSG